jgi:hypothetical protein
MYTFRWPDGRPQPRRRTVWEKYFTSHLGDVSYGDSLTVRRPRILKEEGDFDPALSNPFEYLPIEKFQATIRSCWAAKVHDLSKLE